MKLKKGVVVKKGVKQKPNAPFVKNVRVIAKNKSGKC